MTISLNLVNSELWISVNVKCLFGVKVVTLKSNSSSCGCGQVYDGIFSSQSTIGDGITARLLKKSDIKNYNGDYFNESLLRHFSPPI